MKERKKKQKITKEKVVRGLYGWPTRSALWPGGLNFDERKPVLDDFRLNKRVAPQIGPIARNWQHRSYSRIDRFHELSCSRSERESERNREDECIVSGQEGSTEGESKDPVQKSLERYSELGCSSPSFLSRCIILFLSFLHLSSYFPPRVNLSHKIINQFFNAICSKVLWIFLFEHLL